jgi:hypothetical protein
MRRFAGVPMFCLVLLLPCLVGTKSGSAARADSATCPPVWSFVAYDGPEIAPPADFASIAGSSASDVWRVGYEPFDSTPAIVHFDGDNWTRVATPDVGPGRLTAVTATSPTDAWAVGSRSRRRGPSALVEHWDGLTWKVVHDAFAGAIGVSPSGVASSGPDEVWVLSSGFGLAGPLEHWDGVTWTVTPLAPIAGDNMTVDGIDTSGPHDAWVVGTRENAQGRRRTLAEHWNGTEWRFVRTPSTGGRLTANVLFDVAATVRGDAWAVGATGRKARGPLLMHWDGTSWLRIANPAGSPFTSISDAGPNDVWANRSNVVAHYDGDRWTLVTPPYVKDSSARFGPMALTGEAVWEGPNWRLCPSVLSDHGFDSPVIEAPSALPFPRSSIRSVHPAGVAWRVPADAAAGHTVSDASGLGLFDSGPIDPGGSFAYGFPAAGTYPVVDRSTGNSQRVSVAMRVTPAKGQLGQRYLVQWGFSFAPPTQVQIRIPDSDQFVDWPGAEHRAAATFSAADPLWGGPGAYSFRTRLSDTSGATGWSPVATVKVKCCHVGVLEPAFRTFRPNPELAYQGATVTWIVNASDTADHRVVDGSGLGLYDSGRLSPGQTFSYQFAGAGTYPVTDPLAGGSGAVEIPVQVSTRTGSVGDEFTIQAASGPLPPGVRVQVQISKNAGAFRSWRSGAVNLWTATARGSFAFEGRVVRSSDGVSSEWSPPVSIVIV